MAPRNRARVAHPPYVLNRSSHRLVAVPAADGGENQGSQVLLLGGEGQGGLLRDAYLLDLSGGLFTTQLGVGPDGRAGAAVAFDEERGEVVLAGGRGSAGERDDTWTFRPTQGWTYRR